MNTDSRFAVRPATTADAASLARLRFEFRTRRTIAVEDEAAFLVRAETWMRDRLAQHDRWRAWIVESEGTIVGNIWLQVVEKLPNPGSESESHGYVTNFFVVTEFRGAGAGSLLLGNLKQECGALDVDTIFLWPSAESRSLYARHGFASTNDVLTFKR